MEIKIWEMRNPKTPPSLKWLINKKARLMGEIYSIENSLPIYIESTKVALEKAENQAKRLRIAYESSKDLQEKLPKLKSQLEAINIALGIHEIQIDPELIAPIKPKPSSRLAYGQLTRGIFEFFRVSKGGATTKEVALFLATKFQIDETQSSLVIFTETVRRRLKNLASAGKILRIRNQQNSHEGTWDLPP